MLRHYGQHGGGVLVYTKNILRELSRMESAHEYVLIYNNKDFIGTYSNDDNIREVSLSVPSKIMWDQFALPFLEKREKFDLIFNPKYSLPLFSECQTVFVCHGLDWYVMPWGSKWSDRISHKYLIPRYADKADKIIAVSETTKNHLIKFLNVKEEKIKRIYLGVDDIFFDPVGEIRMSSARRRYHLPERYFLYVGQIYPPKNFGRLLRAYAAIGPEIGRYLVVAGQHAWLCGNDIKLIESLGIEKWVIRVGWVGQDHLPALYCMADALLLPSLYESFAIPIIEAMSSGCPVLTSNCYGTREISGDAALLVSPECVESIAMGMRQIAMDEETRSALVEKGKERSKQFSWGKCVRETIHLFESLVE